MVKLRLPFLELLTEAVEAIQLLLQEIKVCLQLAQVRLQQSTVCSAGMHTTTCR